MWKDQRCDWKCYLGFTLLCFVSDDKPKALNSLFDRWSGCGWLTERETLPTLNWFIGRVGLVDGRVTREIQWWRRRNRVGPEEGARKYRIAPVPPLPLVVVRVVEQCTLLTGQLTTWPCMDVIVTLPWLRRYRRLSIPLHYQYYCIFYLIHYRHLTLYVHLNVETIYQHLLIITIKML